MAKEGPVDDIKPFENVKISLGPGGRRHFKIFSRMMPVPLRVRSEAEKLGGSGRMLFSQGVLRPNMENCDKFIQLGAKDVFSTYCANRENEKIFIEENTYITVEADRELNISFQCIFGKGIFSI